MLPKLPEKSIQCLTSRNLSRMDGSQSQKPHLPKESRSQERSRFATAIQTNWMSWDSWCWKRPSRCFGQSQRQLAPPINEATQRTQQLQSGVVQWTSWFLGNPNADHKPRQSDSAHSEKSVSCSQTLCPFFLHATKPIWYNCDELVTTVFSDLDEQDKPRVSYNLSTFFTVERDEGNKESLFFFLILTSINVFPLRSTSLDQWPRVHGGGGRCWSRACQSSSTTLLLHRVLEDVEKERTWGDPCRSWIFQDWNKIDTD